MNLALRTFAAVLTALFVFAGLATAKAQPAPKPNGTVSVGVVPDPLAPVLGDSTPAPQASTATPSAIATPPPAPAAPKKSTYNRCQVPGPYIALTFDDGPIPKTTPRLLDLLKARGVKATFYVIGQNVVQYPEIAQRIVAEGHEIGNHSYSHPSFKKVGLARTREEISKTNDAILQATGVRPATLRPPYGATNEAITKLINEEFQLPLIMWSVDPLDWKIRKASHVSNHILQNTTPGCIVLSHDIHPSTVDAMPAVLDGLSAKGYQFVTVSELIALDGAPTPTPTPAPTPANPVAPAGTIPPSTTPQSL